MDSGNVSGGNPFDPCRQWLGISALELDDPKKLLALDAADDPIRILQAAEVRLARLRSVESGPYEVARRALVARVEEARDRLLTAASATGMAATPPPPGGLAMPPSPTSDADESPSLEQPFHPAADPFLYPHTSGPNHPPAVPYPPPLGQPGHDARFLEVGYAEGTPGAAPYPSHHQSGTIPHTPIQRHDDGLRAAGPIYRRSSSSGPVLMLVGALFTVVVALGLFAQQLPPSKSVAQKPSAPKPVARKPPKPVEHRRHPLAARDSPFNPEDDDPTNPPQGRVDDTPGVMAREPAVPEENPEPEQPDSAPAEPETPRSPEPPMKKPEPQPAEEPDPLARIDDAVKQCLAAVSQRDYDTATGAMKAVEGIAPDDREANRIAGWVQLVMYAKGFYDYENQAIDAMKPGDEYDIKTKKIAVVEVTDKAVTVKVAGQLKTWQRDDIPAAVTRAVVESWFDDKPANQLYLGAYHFTKPEPDLEQAEACWSKAMIGGADAALLIPLLTDPVVVDTLGS